MRGRAFVLVLLGVVLLAMTGSCTDKKQQTTGGGRAGTHAHKAPHPGGVLVELGDEFGHVELVHDPAKGVLRAYILDGEAEKPVRIAQHELKVSVRDGKVDIVVPLAALRNPLTGEAPGDSAQFFKEALPLRALKRFEGEIESIDVKGSRFEKVAYKYPEGNE